MMVSTRMNVPAAARRSEVKRLRRRSMSARPHQRQQQIQIVTTGRAGAHQSVLRNNGHRGWTESYGYFVAWRRYVGRTVAMPLSLSRNIPARRGEGTRAASDEKETTPNIPRVFTQ